MRIHVLVLYMYALAGEVVGTQWRQSRSSAKMEKMLSSAGFAFSDVHVVADEHYLLLTLIALKR